MRDKGPVIRDKGLDKELIRIVQLPSEYMYSIVSDVTRILSINI